MTAILRSCFAVKICQHVRKWWREHGETDIVQKGGFSAPKCASEDRQRTKESKNQTKKKQRGTADISKAVDEIKSQQDESKWEDMYTLSASRISSGASSMTYI